MGGVRADAEAAASVATPAGNASRNRWWWTAAGYLAAGAVLVVVYVRLSMTYAADSDSANILLQASEMLHGNVLLHGWYASDVSFYTTEIPQYALLEAIFGVKAQTAHIAAGMTCALVLLLAVAVARAGARGRRDRLVRTLIAAGIMLAPSYGFGVFTMDLSVGHIGTAVPLLLTWLLLDRYWDAAVPRWWLPALVMVLLAWVQIADPIALIAGIAPVAVAGLAQCVTRLRRPRQAVYPLVLVAAAGAAYPLAAAVVSVIHRAGGYSVNALPFALSPWHLLHENLPAAWKLFGVFGADYAGLSGVRLELAFLHLASVAAVLLAVAVATARYLRLRLVDQVLAAAIVLNVTGVMMTNASQLGAHEFAIVVPFGAALAARQLTTIRSRRPDPQTADPLTADPHTADPQTATRQTATRRWLRTAVAAVLWAAGGLVLAGYTAGLGWELAQPVQPMANTALATWLEDHHLTYGLGGYWFSSSVTMDSGGRADVRALLKHTLQRDLWMSDVSWYDPSKHYANFIVLDSRLGPTSWWEPTVLVRKYFGTPNRTYRAGQYVIEVWNRNLLADIPPSP